MSEGNNKSIAIKSEVYDLMSYLSDEFTKDENRAMALAIIASGKVPKSAVSKHKGANDLVYSYVDHVWITKVLREAFGPYWGFEASEATVESDGTATARGKLTVKIPLKNGTYHTIEFVEYGACLTTSGMQIANRKLSAVSKALVRCAFRAFGIGQEFYKTKELIDWSNDDAWDNIKLQIRKRKKYITEEEVVNFCKKNNIPGSATVENYGKILDWIKATVKVRREEHGND